jgi:hypothetical protein
MKKIIYKQDAIDALDKFNCCGYVEEEFIQLAEAIKVLPSAQRKGNWVGIDDEPCETFECDRCGFVLEDWIQGAFYNYCPNCGADMRGEEE